MRLATILDVGPRLAVVGDDRWLEVATPEAELRTLRALAGAGPDGLDRLGRWVASQPDAAWQPLAEARLGPAVPDPGAIYTIGRNYLDRDGRDPDVGGAPDAERGADAPRPLVYGKLPTSVGAPGAVVSWDPSLTGNVGAEVELGVVIGRPARDVPEDAAMDHVFGYVCVNDMASRDPRLDGDQWLLGKSLPGFCPVGPWVVTADALDPANLRLACAVNGQPFQDGRTSDMRFGIATVVSYLSRHVELRPGDLIATGTPPPLRDAGEAAGLVRAGDVVTAWIEGIGELTTRIA